MPYIQNFTGVNVQEQIHLQVSKIKVLCFRLKHQSVGLIILMYLVEVEPVFTFYTVKYFSVVVPFLEFVTKYICRDCEMINYIGKTENQN